MKSAKRKRSTAERAQEQEGVVPSPNVDFEEGTAEAHSFAPANVDATVTRRQRKRKKNKGKKSVLSSDDDKSDNKDSETKQKAAKEGRSECANLPILPSFPYETEPDDHCESPPQAYQHVVPLLSVLGKGKEVRIYDPYFCNGAVKSNLNNLGFRNVYNVMEDCYSVWGESRSLDFFDALVTNPPYSGDHMERLMNFVTSSRFDKRPWFLLLPNWVHKKDFYVEATKDIRPFYLVPKKRYVYEPPKSFREAKKSDVHKKSSPFISMWYVWGGTIAQNERLIQRFLHTMEDNPECSLARSKSALRDLRRKHK